MTARMVRPGIASAALALIGAASLAAAPSGGRPELNSCHGGDCSWSLTRSQTLLRREASGALYQLSLLGGSAREGSRRIRWNARPHDAYIFCSRRLPAVILAVDGAWQVDVLDFANGPPPVLESSASLYVRTCHPGADWAADGFAARFGYTARAEPPDIALSRPDDIFRYAR